MSVGVDVAVILSSSIATNSSSHRVSRSSGLLGEFPGHRDNLGTYTRDGVTRCMPLSRG